MSLTMTVLIALKALRRNAMRTVLTALGMIIGVAAVIVMVAIGNGARASIESSIRSAGSNVLNINAGSFRRGPVHMGAGNTNSLTTADAAAIREQVTGIRYLSPGVNLRTQAISDSSNWGTTIQGVGPDLLDIRAWAMEHGSFFGEQEVRTAAKVAVLGSVVRDELFGPGLDPTGATIRIRRQPFRVIGVLTKKGQAAFGQDQDDAILIPYTAAQKKLLGIAHLQNMIVGAEDEAPLERVTADITNLLRARHNIIGDQDDFMVRSADEMVNVLTSTTDTMTYLLAGIAAVSLLVGGIGIMNIMLVSVTERTREIGLRLSLGARDIDVLLQFLVEAIVLSLAGGAIGIALGFGVSSGMASVMGWTTVVTSNAVLMSFGFAAAIGVFFGFYPARKAASLDPIEALRYE
jgi:putative ABC transport system permease protein